MNSVYQAASSYILEKLVDANPALKQFYKPSDNPGAKVASANWIIHDIDDTVSIGSRIAIQIVTDDKIIRIDAVFKSGSIILTYHTRKVDVRAQLNSNIKVYREVSDGKRTEESYMFKLADPQSLAKVVELVSNKLHKIL